VDASGEFSDVDGPTALEGLKGPIVPGAGIASSVDENKPGSSHEGDPVEFSAMQGHAREMRESAKRKQTRQMSFITSPQF